MQINLNLDLEKLRQKQRQKTKTGLSMQATVNGALHLPTQNPQQPVQPMNNPNGWGANAQ